MRRIAALEEQIASLESQHVSQISYFTGNAAQVAAKIAELSGAKNGTVMAVLKDEGEAGVFTDLYVKFPSGWLNEF